MDFGPYTNTGGHTSIKTKKEEKQGKTGSRDIKRLREKSEPAGRKAGGSWGRGRDVTASSQHHPLNLQAQVPEQEPHYASLQKLPVSSGDLTDREEGEGMKEDPSTDYACIAKSKPT